MEKQEFFSFSSLLLAKVLTLFHHLSTQKVLAQNVEQKAEGKQQGSKSCFATINNAISSLEMAGYIHQNISNLLILFTKILPFP